MGKTPDLNLAGTTFIESIRTKAH